MYPLAVVSQKIQHNYRSNSAQQDKRKPATKVRQTNHQACHKGIEKQSRELTALLEDQSGATLPGSAGLRPEVPVQIVLSVWGH